MNYFITSKKLFLTALIMILALSLLTVSCKKSQPTTPTNNPAGTETGSNTGTSDSGSNAGGSSDTGTSGSDSGNSGSGESTTGGTDTGSGSGSGSGSEGSGTGSGDSGSSSGSTDTGTGGSTGGDTGTSGSESGSTETTTKEITADAITTAFKNIATYSFTNTSRAVNAAVDFANFTPQNGIANLTNTSNSGTIASYSRSTVQFTNIIAQKLNIEGATFKIEAPDYKESGGIGTNPLTANVTISLQDSSKYKFASPINGYTTEGSDIKISIKFYGKEWKAN